jgi:malonyl-CoA decarboxylase
VTSLFCLDTNYRSTHLPVNTTAVLKLVLKRITYEDTAASVIELISRKEAVHPMKSLTDLRSRLGPGRRVFSLFHPFLPGKPLAFVHVALKNEIPSAMSQVMQVSSKEHPKVAAFYSITNAAPGLAGIGLGAFLIKESIKVSS